VVEPDRQFRAAISTSIEDRAHVRACENFETAKHWLDARYDLRVTNLRLGDFNGLNLVALMPNAMTAIVYMEPEDLYLVREARRMGARVEPVERLIPSLRAHVSAWHGGS
jgi:hypothetical protein